MRQKISGKLAKRRKDKAEFIKISTQTILLTTALFAFMIGLRYQLKQPQTMYIASKATSTATSTAIQAKNTSVSVVISKDIPTMIEQVSRQHGANPSLMKKVAFCESSYRPEAVGDGGRAKNIFQFHKPTFNEFEKKYGEDLNYNSAYDQTKLASKMIRDGKGSHWTCHTKILAMK